MALIISDIQILKSMLSELPPSLNKKSICVCMPITSLKMWHKKSASNSNEIRQIDYSPNSVAAIKFPTSAYVAKLRNVYCLPNTEILLTHDGFLIEDEIDHFYEIDEVELKGTKVVKAEDRSIKVNVNLRQFAWVESGISLLGNYTSNYFHFITEVLPKIILINESEISLNIPFLIERNLNKNLYSLLAILNTQKRKVITLKPYTLYSADELVLISPLSVTLDVHRNTEVKLRTTLDLNRIKKAVDIIKKSVALSTFKTKQIHKRKIYARRKSHYRNILNELELIDALSKINFEIINLDNLDIESQINLFNSSEVVIGPTGAQLTNIVWCNTDTSVYILASDQPGHQLDMWESLAKIPGANVKVFSGRRAFNVDEKLKLHDDFYIDVSAFIATLES